MASKRNDSRLQLRRAEAKVDRALARLFVALEDAAPVGLRSKVALVMFTSGSERRCVGTCAFAKDGLLISAEPPAQKDQLILDILRDSESPDCGSELAPAFVGAYRRGLKKSQVA